VNAKYELISGLSGKRIAVVNADNPYTLSMARRALVDRRQLWVYTQKKSVPVKAKSVFGYGNVTSDTAKVSYTLTLGKETYPVTVPLRGEYFAGNTVAAIAGAVAAGMTLREAVLAAKRVIRPVERVMELSKSRDGRTLIDDTFNNNPDAAIAALSYMMKFPGKKILVFQPMIELGSFTRKGHVDVGKFAARCCDEIILTNNNFSDGFIEGVHMVKPDFQVHILDAGEAAAFVRQHTAKGDTVLFKGKEALFVLKNLL